MAEKKGKKFNNRRNNNNDDDSMPRVRRIKKKVKNIFRENNIQQ